MTLDARESIQAAFDALGIGQKIAAAVADMPPASIERPRKAVDFAPILQIIQSDLLAFIDKLNEDIKD